MNFSLSFKSRPANLKLDNTSTSKCPRKKTYASALPARIRKTFDLAVTLTLTRTTLKTYLVHLTLVYSCYFAVAATLILNPRSRIQVKILYSLFYTVCASIAKSGIETCRYSGKSKYSPSRFCISIVRRFDNGKVR